MGNNINYGYLKNVEEEQLRDMWLQHVKGGGGGTSAGGGGGSSSGGGDNNNKSMDNHISRTQAKKFLRRFAKSEGEYNGGEIINRLFDEIDMNDKPNNINNFLTYEQFRELFFTVSSKCKIPYLPSLEHAVAPRNQELMDKFREYTKIPFQPSTHDSLVKELWMEAYPGSDPPEIPSKEWDRLGFQGTDPSTDFRGSGLCGIESLLALVKQTIFFKHVHQSSVLHSIPFATAGINVVMICFGFLGWGFKSPGIPNGKCPSTYRHLCKLLFDFAETGEDGLQLVKLSFFKIFMVMFGTMENVWNEMQASYFDFPVVLTKSMDAVEEIIKTIPVLFALDRYLIENFSLDITFFQKHSVFQIWLPEGNYRSVRYKPDIFLYKILDNLSEQRDLKDYKVYDICGIPITDTNIQLGSLPVKVIFYYPKDKPPQVGKVYFEKKIFNTKQQRSRSCSSPPQSPLLIPPLSRTRPSQPSGGGSTTTTTTVSSSSCSSSKASPHSSTKNTVSLKLEKPQKISIISPRLKHEIQVPESLTSGDEGGGTVVMVINNNVCTMSEETTTTNVSTPPNIHIRDTFDGTSDLLLESEKTRKKHTSTSSLISPRGFSLARRSNTNRRSYKSQPQLPNETMDNTKKSPNSTSLRHSIHRNDDDGSVSVAVDGEVVEVFVGPGISGNAVGGGGYGSSCGSSAEDIEESIEMLYSPKRRKKRAEKYPTTTTSTTAAASAATSAAPAASAASSTSSTSSTSSSPATTDLSSSFDFLKDKSESLCWDPKQKHLKKLVGIEIKYRKKHNNSNNNNNNNNEVGYPKPVKDKDLHRKSD